MLELIFAIVKALFPFLKESLLEGGTVRQWVSRNRSTCVWFGFHLLMLFMLSHLMTTAFKQVNQINQLVTVNARYLAERDAAVQEQAALRLQLTELELKHTEVVTDRSALTKTNMALNDVQLEYESTMRRCGLIERNHTFICPRPVAARKPTPRPAPPTVSPVEPEKHTPTFTERLKQVFSREK